MVFNPTTDFKITQAGVLTPARFIFTELFEGPGGAPEGRITGWSNVPAPADDDDLDRRPQVPLAAVRARARARQG